MISFRIVCDAMQIEVVRHVLCLPVDLDRKSNSAYLYELRTGGHSSHGVKGVEQPLRVLQY